MKGGLSRKHLKEFLDDRHFANLSAILDEYDKENEQFKGEIRIHRPH